MVDLTNTFEFREYRIPQELALLTGGGGETFAIVSDAHMRCLRRDADIQPNHHILEVGCGIGRDAIPLSEFLSPAGSYTGVDIVKQSIDWCTQNITSKYSNFRFVHFDVNEPLHNPRGTITSQTVSFPIPSAVIDRIILWSVFTHMVPADTVHYLREFRRLLRPGGRIYATCFILDDETLAKARATAPSAWGLTFSHEYRRGAYLQDAACPTYAIGYAPVSLIEMIATSGLKLDRFIRGSWCGLHGGEAGQDVMILRLPLRARLARTVLGKVSRHYNNTNLNIRRLALQIPALRRLRDERNSLLNERDNLSARLAESERHVPPPSSPYFHYHSSFDPEEVMRRHAISDVHASPGYLTNFLGVRIDPKFFPNHPYSGMAGQVEGIPIPANNHADMAEWGAALRAVDLARNTFTVIELGCGWGCWLNNTGTAARRIGLDVHLIGVEADEAHTHFAQEACATNGFVSHQLTLHRGIAAPSSGIALFPRQGQGGINWGLEPIFGATAEQREVATQSGRYDELPMISLDELTALHNRIDLLHIDIQGGEADLIASSLPALCKKVAYLVVGTHSRQIEGRVMDTLLEAGWKLEIERPAIFAIDDGRPRILVDGVQGWRNPCHARPGQGHGDCDRAVAAASGTP